MFLNNYNLKSFKFFNNVGKRINNIPRMGSN